MVYLGFQRFMRDFSLSKKNNEIQILRALAVLLTLCEHFSIISIRPFALVRSYIAFWPGVDIFLVISGYVITRSLYSFLDAVDRQNGVGLELKVFWYKRMFRILPAAWSWLLITLITAFLLQGTVAFPSFAMTLRDAVAAFFNYANFHWALCWIDWGFGKFCSEPAVLSHYWSLSLEEQFYLIYPIALLVCRGRVRAVVLIALTIYLATLTRGPLGFGWHGRVDGLVMGCCLGFLLRKKSNPCLTSVLVIRCCRLLPPFILFAILWWAGAGFEWYISQWGAYPPFWLWLIALLATVLVFFAILEQQLIWVPSRIRPALLYVGERSYGLYLAHLPCYALVKSTFYALRPDPEVSLLVTQMFVGVGVSFFMAEATYRYVERPFREYGVGLAARLKGATG